MAINHQRLDTQTSIDDLSQGYIRVPNTRYTAAWADQYDALVQPSFPASEKPSQQFGR